MENVFKDALLSQDNAATNVKLSNRICIHKVLKISTTTKSSKIQHNAPVILKLKHHISKSTIFMHYDYYLNLPFSIILCYKSLRNVF